MENYRSICVSNYNGVPMYGYSGNQINLYVYSQSELLNYSLVQFISNVVISSEKTTHDIHVTAKENISDIILAMLRCRSKSIIILDFDSMFFPDKLSIIEKLNTVSRTFKTIAICNEKEYESFSKLYSALFDAVMVKKAPLSEMEQIFTHEIKEISEQKFNMHVDNPMTSSHYQFLMLTPREDTILRKIMSGSNSDQIARELFISSKTVYTHRSNIYAKFHVRTLSELYNCLKRESLMGSEYGNGYAAN